MEEVKSKWEKGFVMFFLPSLLILIYSELFSHFAIFFPKSLPISGDLPVNLQLPRVYRKSEFFQAGFSLMGGDVS